MSSLLDATSASQREALRPGGWLPAARELELWLAGEKQRLDAVATEPLHPEVQELKDLIERDPVIRMYFHRMIEEVPRGGQFREHRVESLDQMLRLLNGV